MVQIARYHDHLSSNPSPFFSPSNHHLLHAVHSYSFFIRGDDDSLASLDAEYDQRLQHQVDDTESAVNSLRQEALDLESRLLAARSTPSSRELLEKEKAELVEDARKFNAVVENFESKVAAKEKALEEREKELSAKVEENRRICEENEELKRQIDSQAVNVRDVERMKRELQAVERDIADAETERNAWEEKMWDLEATAGQNIKELEGLITESNQTIRKLKLGHDFQYVLNAEGSTPAEVLGVDYKATLKPTLTALADEAKKSSMAKLEELILLQQQSRENAAKHEAKKTHLAALQSRFEEIEARSTMVKKEIQDQAASCMAEAERLRKDAERREHNLDLTEKEAEEYLKRCEHNLQDVIRQNDEETQMCIGELLALIDAVSKYKEYNESTISQMKGELSETAGAITDAYKASLSAKIATFASNPST
ncbi:kinetochore protein ndc80 [Cinnamomum micranthum f. kanehirae]|uniref:Kinetochore protein ndc80 n=1 Tax=Cinnamomum micranthum f. kanehirae TaxID=337451 RepID=A0A3S3QSR3_9MAGN|nr:kinetochore protein ndc80 [Cinnamomum micranthum f. kanehirae]